MGASQATTEIRRLAGGTQELLIRGAQALWTHGNLTESRAWFDAGYRAAEWENDGPAMASAAIGLGGLWVHEHRFASAAALIQARLARALRHIDPRSSLALRIRTRLAAEADFRAGRHTGALAMLEEAVRSDDPLAKADALNLAHHCLLGPENASMRLRLAEELMAEGLRTDRRSDVLLGLVWHAVDLLLDGDPRADRDLAELRAMLAAQQHAAVEFVVRAIDVMRSIRAGDFDQAESRARDCAELGQAVGDLDSLGWYGAHLVAIRWFQGEIARLVPELREIVASPTLSAVDHSFAAALALAAASGGDHRQARGMLAALGKDGLHRLPRSNTWMVTLNLVIEAAFLLGDKDIAAQAYGLLEPFGGQPILAGLGVACFGSAHQALGVASLCDGDADRAVTHLRDAVRDNLALAHWPALALSRFRLSQALALRGDAAEAEVERRAAIGEADKLKMRLPAPEFESVDLTAPLVCQRHGRFWTVEIGQRRVQVAHSVGMAYLAVLLANPGVEIGSAELAAGPRLAQEALATKASGSRQVVLDKTAVTAYRTRIASLKADLERYEANGDAARASLAHTERDWLIGELSAAAGFAGRARSFDTADERARIAVGKAIRRAVSRIGEADSVIGNVLRVTVQTGGRCCYRPALDNK